MAVTERWAEKVDRFMDSIGTKKQCLDYRSANRRLSPTECGGEYQFGYPSLRLANVIEGIYIGIDNSGSAVKNMYMHPKCRIALDVIKLKDNPGNPFVIVPGIGEARGSINKHLVSKWGIDSIIQSAVEVGDSPLDMHKYISLVERAFKMTNGHIDGYLLLLSKEPDDTPTSDERALIRRIANRVLWFLPGWKELEHGGTMLTEWDEGYQKRIIFFPEGVL